MVLFFGHHFLDADTGQKNGSSGIFAQRGNSGAVAVLTQEESYPAGPLPDALLFDALKLEKHKRRLTAYTGGKPVRVYLVALGFSPEGHKRFEGDGKTPEGRYAIDGKNPHSVYYKNLGISYPNKEDLTYAVSRGKSPGGDIKIHGLASYFAELDSEHRLTDWTYGCIAVTNQEMEELFTRTSLGAPIDILP